MVVHVEHTAITNRAMMAPVRFKNMTKQAVSFLFVFRIAHIKPSVWRNNSRLRKTRMDKTSNKHNKHYVEKN